MSVVTIGEAMVELRDDGDRFSAAIAGDAFNTACHLAALGRDVVHAQDLAEDAFAARFDRAFAERRVRRLGRRLDTGVNGAYVVGVDERGERHFHYHRAGSAAGETVLGDAAGLRETVAAAELVYLTGVTLATSVDPESLLGLIAATGTPLAVGLNIRRGLHRRRRTCLVPVAAEEIVASLRSAAEQASYVLGSKEEHELLALRPIDGSIAVVTDGAAGARALSADGEARWAPEETVTVVDTTGAGDSFAAGFLDAHLAGAGLDAGLRAGGRLGAATVGHPGALPPLSPPASGEQDRDRVALRDPAMGEVNRQLT